MVLLMTDDVILFPISSPVMVLEDGGTDDRWRHSLTYFFTRAKLKLLYIVELLASAVQANPNPYPNPNHNPNPNIGELLASVV